MVLTFPLFSTYCGRQVGTFEIELSKIERQFTKGVIADLSLCMRTQVNRTAFA